MPSWMVVLPVFVAALFQVNESAVSVNSNLKTFSHAIKDGILQQATETIVFEQDSGPGTVTEQWFAGKGCVDEDAVMKIYIDGEKTPSLDFNVYLAHGIGTFLTAPLCHFVTILTICYSTQSLNYFTDACSQFICLIVCYCNFKY